MSQSAEQRAAGGTSSATLDVLFVRTLNQADALKAVSAMRSACISRGKEMHRELELWTLVDMLFTERIDRTKGTSQIAFPTRSAPAAATGTSDPAFKEAVLLRHWLEFCAQLMPTELPEKSISLSKVNLDQLHSSDALERAAEHVIRLIRQGRHQNAADYWASCGAPAFATLLPAPACLAATEMASKSQVLAVDAGHVSTAFSSLDRISTHTGLGHARPGQPSVWSGNGRRQVAQQVALFFSSKDSYKRPYIRAWLGLLGDNLDAVLPVCDSWHDHLWAHLFMLTSNSRNVYPTRERILEALDSLCTTTNDRVRREACDFFQDIKSHLIRGTASDMTRLFALLQTCGPSSVRMSAHLAIFLCRCGLWETNGWVQSITTILTRYIDLLIVEKQYDVVALYTAAVPTEDAQVEIYVSFLASIARAGVPDTALLHRDFYLQLAEKAGLNVRRITTQLVDSIIQSPDVQHDGNVDFSLPAADAPVVPLVRIPDSGSLWDLLSSADQERILSLEWMAYSARSSAPARAELLTFANSLAKAYILDKNIGALAAMIEQLDSLLPSLLSDVRIDLTLQPHFLALASFQLREHICFRQYSEVHMAYAAWYSLWLQKPSMPIHPLPEELRQHFVALNYKEQLRQFDHEMENWRMQSEDARERVIRAVKAVLCFPDGWLTSKDPEHQIQEIRLKCIPECLSIWHKVIFEDKNHLASVELVTMLADPYHHIHDCYSEEILQDFLVQVNQNFVCLT